MTHTTGTRSSSRLAAGFFATLALLSAACSDPISNTQIDSAPLLSNWGGNSGNGQSGSAASFAVLANAAVTCTDGTIIGNVGTFMATPTGSVTRTTCPITGSVQVGTNASKAAFNNFLEDYADFTPEPGDVCTTLTGTLAGVELAPGAYCFDAAATLTGVLTLNGPADGEWDFTIGTLGTGALTGSSFSVVMAGQGNACNVQWWVAEAVTMTDSDLKGNILAGAAITLTRGTLTGNAYSRADVTVTGTAVTGCAATNNDDNDCERDNNGHRKDKHHKKHKHETRRHDHDNRDNDRDHKGKDDHNDRNDRNDRNRRSHR